MNKINERIKRAILLKEPLCFAKLGGTESAHVSYYLETRQPRLVRGSELWAVSGIWVDTEDDLQEWCNAYIEATKSVDYILEWCQSQGDQYIIDRVWNGIERFYDFEGIEPYTHGKEGWHHVLKDRRLLFVSPFSDTVKQQVPKFGNLWDGANIQEVITVQSPYSEPLLGTGTRIKWQDKLAAMQNEIAKHDFDVATLGCGAFGLLLCDFIKSLGKTCIYLGGGNQLLFGIRGKRWDESFAKYPWYGTEYWTRPLPHETPQNRALLEGGAYW